MEKINAVDVRCPQCFSRWIRTNTLRGTHVCRRCGYIWDIELMMEVTLNEREV